MLFHSGIVGCGKESIARFIEETMNRIYLDNICFDLCTDGEYWLCLGIEYPIISMWYNVIVGYYDKLRGSTCIITHIGEKEVNVELCYDIIPPLIPDSMIVYNGVSYFGYLSSNNIHSHMLRVNM